MLSGRQKRYRHHILIFTTFDMAGIFANFGKRLSTAFSSEKNMAPTGILKVEGTKIVDTDGKEVLLRGVRSSVTIELGLEDS